MDNKHLRAHGYLTIDEFMSKLTPGLHDYLKSNWPGKAGELHHPEDLIVNAHIYIEIANNVLSNFGTIACDKKH
jgi:hypothetical protein